MEINETELAALRRDAGLWRKVEKIAKIYNTCSRCADCDKRDKCDGAGLLPAPWLKERRKETNG